MAFQTGTRVNPQLGALDFSGFTNAANIQAASLAQLGETVGGAIKARREKKEEKRLNKNAAALVLQLADSNPEIGNQLGITTLEDAATAVETLGGYKPTMSLIMEITKNSRVFDPEIITVGEGDDAVNVLRTSRGQVQLLKEDDEDDGKTASIKDYEYLISIGVPDEEAKKMAFSSGGNDVNFLAEFLSGDLTDNKGDGDDNKGDGDDNNNETITESPTKTGFTRPNRRNPQINNIDSSTGSSEEEQKRYEELLLKRSQGQPAG
jgi:hypothetical protein